MKRTLLLVVILCGAAGYLSVPLNAADPRPYDVPPAFADKCELPSASATVLEGYLGARVRANQDNRLSKVDLEPLLAGFRQRPGSHPWIGEHIGKWMHAATLAWANSNDDQLRAKLDYAARELIQTQEPDGYLGTYLPDKRFGLFEGSDWDVWSHKYNLIGLLTYYQYTGADPALAACRKIGDLLVLTFGPGKKSILAAGTHVGMAATSVLEPMVLLFRFTSDQRYLEFAKYLVSAWNEPNGPKILDTLLNTKSVERTANAKAYEMLSNLNGLCELARVTGNREYLQAAVNAWEDIVARRLYLTGSASQAEHFKNDFFLPNHEGAHVAETCVTTTWIQLNSQLLRLLGEARFGHELERTFYNHLAAAQRPDGAQWCYFTSLEGKKPYGPGINCCVSSGPRGMALVPQHGWLRFDEKGVEGIVLNLFESSRFQTGLNDSPATIELRSEFPRAGKATITFGLRKPSTFSLRIREPRWAAPLRVDFGGRTLALNRSTNGWTVIPARVWNNGDTLDLTFTIGGRLVLGENSNKDKAALAWGPFILAYDDKRNSGLPKGRALALHAEAGQPAVQVAEGKEPLIFSASVRAPDRAEPVKGSFVPFADAGRDGGTYRIWLRAPGAPVSGNDSVFADGDESRSRPGNVEGSINDGDPTTLVVTYNGRFSREDWYAVTLDEPVTFRRVVFTPGKVFHDGGWFDASLGKPRIEVQRVSGGRWEKAADLTTYPATTATNSAGLDTDPPPSFTVLLPHPLKAVGVRVIGRPATGDDPKQAFSSCAELGAFEN